VVRVLAQKTYFAAASEAAGAGVAALATLVDFFALWATFLAFGASVELAAAGVVAAAVLAAGVVAAGVAVAGVLAAGVAANAAVAKSEASRVVTSLFMVCSSPVSAAFNWVTR
jgi:hypothetical protein